MRESSNMGAGGKLMVFAGSLLVVIAVVVLALIALFIYQVFYQPGEVYLVQYLLEHIKTGDQAFHGLIGGNQFYINMSDPVKYFAYLFLLILILGVVASIVRGILVAGTSLIKAANNCRAETGHDESR